MEVTSETNIVGLLKTLIRYFASGFVFIIVFKFLREQDDIWAFTEASINWSIVFAAAISGILIYSVHASVIDDFFYWLSIKYLKKKKCDLYWHEDFSRKTCRQIMFDLTTERYKSGGLKKRKAKALQDRLDQLLMMLVLLYTTASTLIILPIGYSVYLLLTKESVSFYPQSFAIFILGVFFCLIGFILDVKITKRELFMYKQGLAN